MLNLTHLNRDNSVCLIRLKFSVWVHYKSSEVVKSLNLLAGVLRAS